MRRFLLQFFTWWNGQTLGTRFFTWRAGERVGEDAGGNVYYRTRGGAIDPGLGFERRWVVFKGSSEASQIPPGWYGWMHHQTDTPPTGEAFAARPWMRPHRPNATGTARAYRPKGSVLRSGHPSAAKDYYDAWTPGG